MDRNVLRSVGLLRAFVLLSAVVLAGGAVVLGIVLGHVVRNQALNDRRDSLSYKLKRLLRFKAQSVLCTDPYVADDPDLTSLDDVLALADVLVIGAPHSEYTSITPRVPVIDVWNLFGRGVGL